MGTSLSRPCRGLGIEVDEREAARMTTYTEELGGEWYYLSDGSVADW